MAPVEHHRDRVQQIFLAGGQPRHSAAARANDRADGIDAEMGDELLDQVRLNRNRSIRKSCAAPQSAPLALLTAL
jgi:hypothetical protein